MIFFRPCSLKSQTSCFFPFPKNAEQLNKTELNQLLDSANYKLKLEKIKTYLKNNLKGFNGSILLVSKDSIAFELSKGYAEKSSKTINESSTLFELASVSKQFTAASILLLEADGKLKITDSLSRYLIDFPYPGITIHHLLTHQSGLPEYMNFKNKYWEKSDSLMDNQDLINILYEYQPKALSLPGQKYDYNNTGYVILAAIVEQVSHMSFEDFVTENIFKKIGMNHSYFYTQTLPETDSSQAAVNQYLCLQMAHGYDKNFKERTYDYECGLVGDKGIFSTVNDLYLWFIALEKHQVISQDIFNKMTTEYVKTQKNEAYGYGLRLYQNQDGSRDIYHAGLWRGFSSIFYYRPKDHFLWIILSNVFNKAHYYKRAHVLSVLDEI